MFCAGRGGAWVDEAVVLTTVEEDDDRLWGRGLFELNNGRL